MKQTSYVFAVANSQEARYLAEHVLPQLWEDGHKTIVLVTPDNPELAEIQSFFRMGHMMPQDQYPYNLGYTAVRELKKTEDGYTAKPIYEDIVVCDGPFTAAISTKLTARLALEARAMNRPVIGFSDTMEDGERWQQEFLEEHRKTNHPVLSRKHPAPPYIVGFRMDNNALYEVLSALV